MKADFPVILDACVLANIRVCDLFLRLAETPRLYLPFWSETILDETQRTQTGRFGWPAELSESWRSEVTRYFPDACVDDLECAVSPEEVDEKDRHVVQAALRAGAEVIVTFNLRDFPSPALEPIHIFARHPSEFLLTLFSIEPLLVARRINEIAEAKNERPLDVLKRLRRDVPAFVDHFATAAGLMLDEA
ncbi:MAG: PIN domain-containing protein [Verrucomicrobiota bacterium]